MAKLGNIQGYAPNDSGVTERKTLPADKAYVCKVLRAEVVNNGYGDRLNFILDIVEGEYKGFYREDYDAQKDSQYGQKWRGTYSVTIPNDATVNNYGTILKRFNGALGAIEASNAGYSFAGTGFETDTLKGKLVGMVTYEDEYNDHPFTRIGFLISVDRARKGDFKPMKKRTQTSTAAPAPVAPAMTQVDDDDELPF